MTATVSCTPEYPDGWEQDWTIFMWIYHPNATYGMRWTGDGGIGHQAMYDANGQLITGGLSAGTADRVSSRTSYWRHRTADVLPFSWARQLDAHYGGSRYTNLYMQVRPPHTGNAPTNIVE